MKKQIIVSQVGARHRYLIPQLLFKNNILNMLYTDSTRFSFLGRIAYFLKSIGIKNSRLIRLANRNPVIPIKYLYSTDWIIIKSLYEKKIDKNELLYQSLSNKFIKKGLGTATWLYSMYYENLEFVKYAKSKKLKIIIDIYENPNAFDDMLNEINNHIEYSIFSHLIEDYKSKSLFRKKHLENMLELADYYTIPSAFVQKSLGAYTNYDSKKGVILPYPSSINVNKYNYRPIRHKLIWVGNDPVRKGLIYCAKAATILKKKYPDLQFNIIGSVDSQIIKSVAFSDLCFLGVLDKENLINEYETAEAYVFPTLFEGFAGTIIEAASCGCPIITTENAGTDLNEFPAIYIPTRNVNAIVDAVISIFEDSKFRNKLSEDIYNYSDNLAIKVYEKKLISFFDTIN
ncbi:glycosyltransferase family 4 protein [Flavobacterium limnophilum]|uniref:glycosyltransferase family 4 protein n=1 Tax=Flavobacterium limnophilum TaxID=3003262 RepID=UPI002482F40B|nr:glycosyltransferase family 4 protein [Flavobacterium limnophilum]